MTFKLDGTHVMVDLETLGNGSNSVIVAIGAVAFNEHTVLSSFYRVVDAESCIEAGLRMDASTVMWWLKQEQAARDAIGQPGESLTDVLALLNNWYPKDACLWGNGATFDNVILDNAYRAIGVRPPWKYSKHRCFRTMKALFPLKDGPIFEGTEHNALHDAVYQANYLIEIAKAPNSNSL